MKIGHYVPQKRGGPFIIAKTICDNVPNCEMFSKIEDAKNYDLIHLHHQIDIRLLKYPFIETFHGLLPLKYCTNLKAKLSMLRWIIFHNISTRLAKYVIAVSGEANRQINRRANKVIYNGINVKDFNIEKKDNSIMFLNSLEKYENLLVILRALKYVKNECVLDVFGEGRLEKYYKSIATKNVNFHKETENKIIRKRLSKCRCLVQCTLQETFGVPILEAMASGTIAIVSDIKAHRECFENVLFVKANDYKRVAELIDEVFEGKHDNLIPKARKEVENKYPSSNLINGVKKIYKTIEEENEINKIKDYYKY